MGRRWGQRVATVRLPNGTTRTVPVAATEASVGKRLDRLPAPDLRELWKRRKWICALRERLWTKGENQDMPNGSDNDNGHNM
jgi:hypothetical protein